MPDTAADASEGDGRVERVTSADDDIRLHLANVADNLQLIADLGYGDVALAEPSSDGVLHVIADARPNTALAAVPASRVGVALLPEEESEAYQALERGEVASSGRRRISRGIAYATTAYPIGADRPYAVVIRNMAETVLEAPGAMETAFMESAEELLGVLGRGPILDVADDSPFSTVREAGDGLLRVTQDRTITYASPNSVNILRLAGVEGPLRDSSTVEIPGAASAIDRVLGTTRGAMTEVAAADRVLVFRAVGLGGGAVVLVKDVTEERRREQELKVKEATIREVHHRVKNNLQTIASLLRIQARRAQSDEASRALAEAMERVSSMAVVHELLAGSTEECIDFAVAAETVVDMVRRSLAGHSRDIEVAVQGSTGLVPAQVATSLALVLAELVHNAIEHGLAGRDAGRVAVEMRRLPAELVLTVRDDGVGLPEGFDIESSAHLGLAIVSTVVRDDLRGTISFSGGRGTTVTVRFPLPPDHEEGV